MRLCQPMARLCSAIFIMCLTANAGSAQSSDPAWLEDLTMQLAIDKACEVTFFISVREGESGGLRYFEARAQCVDGRQFDASRKEPQVTFDIRECGNVICMVPTAIGAVKLV